MFAFSPISQRSGTLNSASQSTNLHCTLGVWSSLSLVQLYVTAGIAWSQPFDLWILLLTTFLRSFLPAVCPTVRFELDVVHVLTVLVFVFCCCFLLKLLSSVRRLILWLFLDCELLITNNNNITLFIPWEIKVVGRSHNEEHISIILNHEPHAHTHT